MRQSTAKDLAQALFEEAGDALFLFDPDSDQIQDVNPMAERLSGFSRDQLLRLQATYLFRFTGQGGKQRLQHAANKTTVFHSQDGFLLRTSKDGVWVPVNLTITRLHLQPKTLALITARDVREQFEATQRLQKMEAELRRVLASVSDCLWSAEWSADGKWMYRYLSPVVQNLTARPAEHFLADPARWREIIHPEDQEVYERALQQLRGGHPAQVEYRVVLPDNGVRWLRESVRVTRKPEGQSLQLDGVLTDFTDRKHAEELLLAERQNLRALMENLPEAIYFKDAEGRYLVDNAAHRAILGASSEEEVRGKTVRDFLPPDLAEPFHSGDVALVREAWGVVQNEEVLQLPGRDRAVFSFTKVPLHDTGGGVNGLVCIGRDVTAERAAERALANERNLLRTLMDQLPDHIFVKDAQSRFVIANTATLRSLGAASIDEVRGKSDFDFLPRDRAEKFRADEERVVREGKAVFNSEELLIDAAGNARWLLTTKVPLRSADGEVIGLVGISHDITERRTMEAELRRARDVAEAANRAKGEFLARMSHEIRTPMGGVLGMTRLALQTDLNDDQRECLQMVLASGEALLTIINDILDFSRIESGKLQLEATPFHLRDSLADAVRSLALRAQQKGLELACHVTPDVPDLLVGDVGRLRQVIVNLVSNAIKFTEHGEIVVRVHRVGNGSGDLHFDVVDTGIGIPADKRAAIFEPFEQADGSITRKYGGTGLGLAISSQLVTLMGGRMWVDSEVGRGSQFHFTARFEVVAGQADSQGLVEPPDVHGLRVLIVDDNSTQREILHELFTNWRMKPNTVGGAAEALAELRRARDGGEPYPLVLVDTVMPEPDGFALSEQVTGEPGLAGAVVLMVNSSDRPGNADRCKEVGARASILKPLKQSELLDTILSVISSAPPPPPRPAAPAVEEMPAPVLPPLNILMAEDSLINQRLGVRLLEKAGHRVQVANNGRVALEALERGTFDLVLMDVQMPEMGGFEATEAIRARERETGKHQPIIALTAHAMKGDRERCLAAGMDGYVSKPIRDRELFLTIEQVLMAYAPEALTRGDDPMAASPETEETMQPVFNEAEALDRCGGDRGLLRELIDIFLGEVPGLMAALSSAVQSGDAPTTYRTAHTLKGSVMNFAAEPARIASLELEMMGRHNQMADAQAAYDRLVPLMNELTAALGAFKA